MNEEVLKIQRIFSGLIEGFGLNHSKIYLALLTGEVKTSRQLIEETRISNEIGYIALRQLIKANLIKKTNTVPPCYFIDSPVKILDTEIRKQTRFLEGKKLELKEIIQNGNNGNGNEEYIIKINSDGRELVNRKTRHIIRDPDEIRKIKSELDKLLKEAPDENKYPTKYH